MERYKELFERYLKKTVPEKQPENLYRPVEYILENGGKRIRPLLVLLASEGYGVSAEKALPAAAALEIFHNFTLLHDDIMDRAELRRGKPSVHKKWNTDIAILSGDAMVFLAQQQLENYPPEIFVRLQTLFNQTALAICEGQQADMDFEQREVVSEAEYLEMIRKKTAVLLGTALRFGAVLAGKPLREQQEIEKAGIYLGLIFQMKDDWLDTFGDERFGKKTGGDILDKKKTVLYVKLLEKLSRRDKEEFIRLYHGEDLPAAEKIDHVKNWFRQYNIERELGQEIEKMFNEALQITDTLSLNARAKNQLVELFRRLNERKV